MGTTINANVDVIATNLTKTWDDCYLLCQESPDCTNWRWQNEKKGELAFQCSRLKVQAGKVIAQVKEPDVVVGPRNCSGHGK